ncbi:MAG: Asp-tRNA(Asn)/Glu-tRNA(Gln) amidotransferase subunit GatA [Candidatus Spechtbacteria bacterium SB0662_bin_43]|uniref:Glutamyl-tRNA(Gln) amidotransferase subunit A n=1 Tax=Candidatus Spechtbacteria bacterium SB0662_bin_43 TaxID=2604897 RepID=A0A845D8U8_9BACT|nr:Asp-tRNA(Asn)/Glu-tRNA(Gln) amidotransferase subunit GatA [Candidatus Spechtbacteria bacterium SB0662_bin_43]
MDNSSLTVRSLVRSLRDRTMSSYEITRAVFDVIEEKNEELNGYLVADRDAALSYAQHLDNTDQYKEGHLRGIPYAVKDNILVEGIQATAGSKMLETYIAPYDATAVQKMRNQGVVLLGKTNMDEFAMGSSTETSAFGVAKNPHDTTRVPGGSSGGSAVAVASGMAPFALGSDTGGSIRQPAAFCGVVGFKPSYGTVSRHGLIAMASSLDQIGIFTQNVEDAQLIAPFLFEKDAFDATSVSLDASVSSLKPSEVRIGIVKEHFSDGLSSEVSRRIEKAIRVYEDMGASVVEIELPHMRYALATYYIISCAEVSSNMARFDGIRYGLHNEGNSVLDEYLERRQAGFGAEVQRRIMLGTFVLSSGYYDAYYDRAQQVRKRIIRDYQRAFEKVDVVLGPTTPEVAFKIGEKTNDPLQMYLEDIYTVSVNVAELPAVSIPVGTAQSGSSHLPVGMQLVGAKYSDARLLEIASLYEQSVRS